MTNQIKYNWASLGTGVIANELAQALGALGGKLYSVANRTYDKGVASLRNMALKRFMKRLTKSLKILKWILSTSQRLTIRILITFARPSQLASMSSVKNPSL